MNLEFVQAIDSAGSQWTFVSCLLDPCITLQPRDHIGLGATRFSVAWIVDLSAQCLREWAALFIAARQMFLFRAAERNNPQLIG